MVKVAINGLGRIGRAALKILVETPDLQVVAVNDLVPADNLLYLLRYDSVYGSYHRRVALEGNTLIIGDHRIRLLSGKDPAELPWGELGIDVVLECTGKFTKGEELRRHLQAGAKHAILSAPAKTEEIVTVVYGTNQPQGPVQAISCASCTTNCITPVVEVLDRRVGIKKAMMTTVHAYTSSQSLVDGPNKKFRRGRGGAMNIVPTSTGAAVATTKVLPQLKGKFDGIALRVPVPVGSIADIVLLTKRATSTEEINRIFREEAESPRYHGVLTANEDGIVSSDVIRNPAASVVDLTMTQVVDGDLVKVMSWYDNEWGYASQMVRETQRLTHS